MTKIGDRESLLEHSRRSLLQTPQCRRTTSENNTCSSSPIEGVAPSTEVDMFASYAEPGGDIEDEHQTAG